MVRSTTSGEEPTHPVVPPLATVLNAYIKDVVDAFYPGDEIIVRRIRQHVINLQRDENATDDEIYESLRYYHMAMQAIVRLVGGQKT